LTLRKSPTPSDVFPPKSTVFPRPTWPVPTLGVVISVIGAPSFYSAVPPPDSLVSSGAARFTLTSFFFEDFPLPLDSRGRFLMDVCPLRCFASAPQLNIHPALRPEYYFFQGVFSFPPPLLISVPRARPNLFSLFVV